MAKPRGPKKQNGEAGATPAEAVAAIEASALETPKVSSRKPTPKPVIVKGESRANLIPINVEEEIRRLAYLMSERRGFEPGHETEDWLTAEREVQQRYHQHSA